MDTTDRLSHPLSEHEEQLLEQFFASARQPLADHGFSRRVMRHLPRRSHTTGRLWALFCSLLGVGFVVHQRLWQSMADALHAVVKMLSASDVCYVSTPTLLLSAAILSALTVFAAMTKIAEG